MAKTRKITKENEKLLSMCRSVTIRLTRADFSSYERSKLMPNIVKSNASASTVEVSRNLRTRLDDKKMSGEYIFFSFDD